MTANIARLACLLTTAGLLGLASCTPIEPGSNDASMSGHDTKTAPDSSPSQDASTADTNGTDAHVANDLPAPPSDVPSDVPCKPSCSAGMLTTCTNNQPDPAPTACDFGCNMAGDACATLVPSNGLASQLAAGTGAFSVGSGSNVVVNTDTGVFTCAGLPCTFGNTFEVVRQTAGPAIGVFGFASIDIEDGKVTVVGSNALALLSQGPVKINGLIDIRPPVLGSGLGGYTKDAPGGLPVMTTTPADGAGQTACASGGGGSFGAPGGGAGGNVTDLGGIMSQGGTSGQVVAAPTLSPLRGGAPGGTSKCGATVSLSGRGGGALQIVSQSSIHFLENGEINASGGGGQGSNVPGGPNGGGGGGSGGGDLLEAAQITVDARAYVVAKGGGGGAGGESAPPPSDGEPGQADDSVAVGGISDHAPSGNGGNGGLGGMSGARGGDDGAPAGAGGGGGGSGLIVVNVSAGAMSYTNAGFVSPDPILGRVTTQ